MTDPADPTDTRRLWWVSADGQASIDMGPCDGDQAEALETLLGQCADDEQRDDIRAGTFEVA